MNSRFITHMLRMGSIGVLALTLNACALFKVGGNDNDTYTKPVSLNVSCEQREENNHYDKISAKITNNVVEQLNWTSQPKQGQCQFQLKDFNQVATQPQIDLQSRTDKQCHLYIWQNGQYVTVSSYNCAKVCTANDYILPILLDPTTGACRKTGR